MHTVSNEGYTIIIVIGLIEFINDLLNSQDRKYIWEFTLSIYVYLVFRSEIMSNFLETSLPNACRSFLYSTSRRRGFQFLWSQVYCRYKEKPPEYVQTMQLMISCWILQLYGMKYTFPFLVFFLPFSFKSFNVWMSRNSPWLPWKCFQDGMAKQFYKL